MARFAGSHLFRGALSLLAVAALATPAALAEAPAGHDLAPIDGGARRFAIDRFEVTIGQFRRFVAATGRVTRAEREGGGFQYRAGWERMSGWSWRAPYGKPGHDDEPAVHVTWHEAKAYCAWAGLRLPSDAEWLLAAYTERRTQPPRPFVRDRRYRFPTGETADGANHIEAPPKAVDGWRLPVPVTALGQGRGHVPVRRTAPGVNGLWDMGANVWEWVDHDVAGRKRTRGGSWWYGTAQMQADALYEKPADFPAVYIGFRCARSRN
ncbi:MAG: formylglycine-generating enzyme family protein [Hyphomicrobiaceae bacterium]